MSDISVKRISTLAELQLLKDDWTSLLSQSCASGFFLTWEWLSAWAIEKMSENRTLFVLVVYDKNNLICIAPFYIQHSGGGLLPNKELRFLGTPETGSDYLDVMTRKGCEQKAAEALYDILHTRCRSDWNQIKLTDIRADSLFLLHFINRLESAGKYYEYKRHSYCPGLKLPETEEQFYADLSTGWRKKFKQDQRVLTRDYTIDHQTHTGTDAEQRLDEFFQHYQQYTDWSANSLKPVLETLISQNLHHHPVQLDFLYVNGTLRAALLHLVHKKSLAMFLMTVDKEFNPKISLGNVLVGRTIINAIASGYSYYDFLKGDERYKFHWSTEGLATVSLHLWQKRPAAMISAVDRLARNLGKLLLR